MSRGDTPQSDARRTADPLADDTISRILGAWENHPDPDLNHTQWDAIAIVNREIARWEYNGQLDGWQASPGVPPHIAEALEDYVRIGRILPSWADAAKIARAEDMFIDGSMLSCTLLFCASLPECYVIPDLASVLHAAGQLEQHTEYRIRSTAAMIFPVMMRGGLTAPEGGGVAQTLKVRLIHATIRHLILRGNPGDAVASNAPAEIPPLPMAGPAASFHQSLFTQGWNVQRAGLPCNQEELAYTLLTFHYVFLRGLRTLGLRETRQNEEAYLHAWNVLGHVLGIERRLMTDTMDQAKLMFDSIQLRSRGEHCDPDARPDLGWALMQTMQGYIPFRVLKPFPVLLTRYLCGSPCQDDLALTKRVSIFSRAAFVLIMGTIRCIDSFVRLFLPQFSLSRMLTRAAGYQLTVKILMDQTRPLKLPSALLNEVNTVTQAWHNDPKAPGWVNWVERYMTGRKQRKAA
ncbi:oxygenase MpaB family protein [Pseudoduganella sp. RAF53_2]|uniref:oxygenase MpaB family protein n=1 Tax=unclassified Pseudoduganella TaxID=2637179 RepID=UPI003F99FDFA